MLPKNRQEAVASGKNKYFTGKPCKHGHISNRRTCDAGCCECVRIKNASDFVNNKDDKIRRSMEWAKNNPDRWKEIRSKCNQTKSTKEKKREWAKANSDVIVHHVVLRNARKMQSIPAWADKKAIKQFYVESRRLTQETGIRHVVDHIIPLVSNYVCGLHVESNLQVITEKENLSKYNNFRM